MLKILILFFIVNLYLINAKSSIINYSSVAEEAYNVKVSENDSLILVFASSRHVPNKVNSTPLNANVDIFDKDLNLVKSFDLKNYYYLFPFRIFDDRYSKFDGSKLEILVANFEKNTYEYKMLEWDIKTNDTLVYDIPDDILRGTPTRNFHFYITNDNIIYLNNEKEIIILEKYTSKVINKIENLDYNFFYYNDNKIYYRKAFDLIEYSIESKTSKYIFKYKSEGTNSDFVAANDKHIITCSYSNKPIEINFFNRETQKLEEYEAYSTILDFKLKDSLFIYKADFYRPINIFNLATLTNTLVSQGGYLDFIGDSYIKIDSYSIKKLNSEFEVTKEIINSINQVVDMSVKGDYLAFMSDARSYFYNSGRLCIYDLKADNIFYKSDAVSVDYKLDENGFYHLFQDSLLYIEYSGNRRKIVDNINYKNTDFNAMEISNNKIFISDLNGNILEFEKSSNNLINEISIEDKKIFKIDNINDEQLLFCYPTDNNSSNTSLYIYNIKEKKYKSIGLPFSFPLTMESYSRYNIDELTNSINFITSDSLLSYNIETEEIDLNKNKIRDLYSFFRKRLNSMKVYNNFIIIAVDNELLFFERNSFELVKVLPIDFFPYRNFYFNNENKKEDNRIKDFVISDNYLVILDAFGYIYKHDSNILSVEGTKDEYLECQNLIEIEYYDLLGNTLTKNNILNKKIVVKYKCLETNNFIYKLEIRE